MLTANRLKGVTVATVLPFKSDGQIDWGSYEKLIRYTCFRSGITAVFVNGHAGEVATLSPQERTEVIQFTRRLIGKQKPLMAGVVAYSTQEAQSRAAEAELAGADVAVLFPFPQFSGGAGTHPYAGLDYVEAIAKVVDIPLSIFQYPLQSGAGFTTPLLTQIAQNPRVIAIKEGSGTIGAYEDNWRSIRAAAPHVAFLPSNYDWWLPQLAIGADGILSGLGSLVPEHLTRLWAAAEKSDLVSMRQVNDQLYPIVRGIYGAPPIMNMHSRIKVALAYLGVIAHAQPRPPLPQIPADEVRSIQTMVEEWGVPRYEHVITTDS